MSIHSIRRSTIDGELSPSGVQHSADKHYYSFDLKLFEGKYTLSSKRFDLEKSIKEFKEKNIPLVVDVETTYPLNIDDVIIN